MINEKYSGTVNVKFSTLRINTSQSVEMGNPLENLTFVEDSQARFIANQEGNALIVSGEKVFESGSSTAELILGGVDSRLKGETISISWETGIQNGPVTLRQSTPVVEQTIIYSYDPDKEVNTLGRNVIDLDATGYFSSNPEVYNGQTLRFTLTWSYFSASYTVRFTDTYKDNIESL